MRLEYDRDADALYIAIRPEVVSRTEQLDRGTLVDLDMHGHLIGVEVIQPARRWLDRVEQYRNEIPPQDWATLEALFASDPQKRYAFESTGHLSAVS